MLSTKFKSVINQNFLEKEYLKGLKTDRDIFINAMNIIKESKDPLGLTCSDSMSLNTDSVESASGNFTQIWSEFR